MLAMSSYPPHNSSDDQQGNQHESLFTSRSISIGIGRGLVALYVVSADGGFPLDDSWIHQVYGQNLALRGEWAFIPGQPSAASTSPLYTVLLAIGYLLRLPYALWTHTLGVIALAAAGIFGAHLADRLLPNRDRIGLLTGVGVVLTWQLIWGAASGMETILFGALCLALIVLLWHELDPHNYLLPALITRAAFLRGLRFGAIAALTTLARPEGILLVAIAGRRVDLGSPAQSDHVDHRGKLGFCDIDCAVFSAESLAYRRAVTEYRGRQTDPT